MRDLSDEVRHLTRLAYEECARYKHLKGQCSCKIRSGVEDRAKTEHFPMPRFVAVGKFLPCRVCIEETEKYKRSIHRGVLL